MQLSKNATQDLRIALQKSFGEEFDSALTDEQIERIGDRKSTRLNSSHRL